MSIPLGSQRRCKATFRDENGVLADPTTVTCIIRTPGGTETSYVYGTDAEVVKSSTGVYYLDLTTAAAGPHFHRWKGTGTVVTANEAWFRVDASEYTTP